MKMNRPFTLERAGVVIALDDPSFRDRPKRDGVSTAQIDDTQREGERKFGSTAAGKGLCNHEIESI